MMTETSVESPVAIRTENLLKMFGDFAALQDVSFSVRRAAVTAFLGPNGAGKSTTMRILTGFMSPTAGTVSLAGLDPTDPEQRIELARKLGYMPENGPLYQDMTPMESLRFFADIRRMTGVPAAIDRVVGQCALDSVVHKPIHKLSRGYRQRVGMAQALLHSPEVLILDEPTSGLDPIQIEEVRTLIRKLGETVTILLSTHILQEVSAIAEEVLMISDGRIVFSGSKEDLVRDRPIETRFSELTASQAALSAMGKPVETTTARTTGQDMESN